MSVRSAVTTAVRTCVHAPAADAPQQATPEVIPGTDVAEVEVSNDTEIKDSDDKQEVVLEEQELQENG